VREELQPSEFTRTRRTALVFISPVAFVRPTPTNSLGVMPGEPTARSTHNKGKLSLINLLKRTMTILTRKTLTERRVHSSTRHKTSWRASPGASLYNKVTLQQTRRTERRKRERSTPHTVHRRTVKDGIHATACIKNVCVRGSRQTTTSGPTWEHADWFPVTTTAFASLRVARRHVAPNDRSTPRNLA
jgi:hypothetical protein